MKRIRLIAALLLCLALTAQFAPASAASKAATTKPTVKITVPKGAMRGGIGGELTITPSVPGFLSLKLLTADGAEILTLCDNMEVHTKENVIEFDAVDPDGASLPQGSYQLSATLINQYGNESKDTTAAFKLGSPKPELSDVSVETAKAFKPTISFYATFDDKLATVSLSLNRVSPQAMYFDDFPEVELKASGAGSVSIDLKKDNKLPSAAGYYTAKGAIVEDNTGAASNPIEIDFVVDAEGNAYLLEDATQDILNAVDAAVTEINNTLANASGSKTASKSTETKKTETKAETKTENTADTKAEGDESDAAERSNKGASESAANAETLTYGSAETNLGDEGLEIGVGVSDAAEQADGSYWTLSSASTNEEIWAAITRTMISVNVAEQESAYIYDSPKEGRKTLGMVSGLSQGVNVIKEREDGWSLVEAYRNEDGAFIRGYIRTNKLRVVEPNTTYGIVVDKAAQKLTIWKDGEPIGSCDVTTGLATPKYLHRETPAGEYILVTRRGTIEYYGKGFCANTIRFSGNYHLCEIPSTKKNGDDFSLLEDSLGEKSTRGHICVAHEASQDGGINAEWIWEMTTENKRVKLLVLDDKARDEVPVGE
ncbi:MAG: L,D-transpeptidase [Clostridia bacterium]|nr:L,D-transpeptidase [Clostridia bacterium]